MRVTFSRQTKFKIKTTPNHRYVAGNTLWAFYQFSVVIVLLSILRARMVNTYHRVFKEADVQWKYFRWDRGREGEICPQATYVDIAQYVQMMTIFRGAYILYRVSTLLK